MILLLNSRDSNHWFVLNSFLGRISSFGKISILLGAFCYGISANFAFAQQSSATSVISIQEKIFIESDFQISDSVSDVLTATGNVIVRYPANGVIAASRQAQYFKEEQLIVLTGDVNIIREEGNSLKADRVVFMINNNQLFADSTPSSQVFSKFIFNPKELNQGIGGI